jgi:hypothetical protein
MNVVDFLIRPPAKHHGASPWILATVLVAAAISLRLLLAKPLEGSAYITFYPTVVAASLFCGWSQGVFAVLLSALAGAYLFLDPLHSSGIQNIAAIAVFLIGGGFTVALIAAISDPTGGFSSCRQRWRHSLMYRLPEGLERVVSRFCRNREPDRDERARLKADAFLREVSAHFTVLDDQRLSVVRWFETHFSFWNGGSGSLGYGLNYAAFS